MGAREFLRKFRVALTPHHWWLRTRLDDGVCVLGRNTAGFGGRGIYVFRDDIEPEFRHLGEFIEPADVFVDVGANTGIYSLRAARCGATVVALEPFPEILAALQRSVALNGFTDRVRVRGLCAGAETGSAALWLNSAKPNSFSLVQRDISADQFSVLRVRLDDLLRWENLPRVHYLKIDAEGAEDQVLEGASQLLKSRPIVQLEVTICKPRWALPDYRFFRAPQSPNVICIPDESSRREIPLRLGWAPVEL